MKKILIYLLLFIALCFGSDFFIDYSLGQQLKNQSPYRVAFASTGANLLESRMDCWAKIETGPSFEEMDQKLLEIFACLELPVERDDFHHQKNNDQIIVSYEMKRTHEKLMLNIQFDLQTKESYFLLSSVNGADDQHQRVMAEKLSENMDLRTCYRYTGQIPEKTNFNGRQQLMELALKSLHAKKIEQYQDQYLISGTAYNDEYMGVESLQIAGQKVNMQVAIKSAASDSNTMIYLGLPLLLNDY